MFLFAFFVFLAQSSRTQPLLLCFARTSDWFEQTTTATQQRSTLTLLVVMVVLADLMLVLVLELAWLDVVLACLAVVT